MGLDQRRRRHNYSSPFISARVFLFLILSRTKEMRFIPLLYSFSLFFSPFCLVSLVSLVRLIPFAQGRSVGLYRLIAPYRLLSLLIVAYRCLLASREELTLEVCRLEIAQVLYQICYDSSAL